MDASHSAPLGAISTMMKTQMDWSDFYAWLMATYWDALATEVRAQPSPEAPIDGVMVPEDIWRAALLMYPDPTMWLRNPIPNLGGKTALNVIESGESDRIRAIIQDIAPFMLPSPEDMSPGDR